MTEDHGADIADSGRESGGEHHGEGAEQVRAGGQHREFAEFQAEFAVEPIGEQGGGYQGRTQLIDPEECVEAQDQMA